MRIMCVAAVLIVYISDRRKELTSQAGLQFQEKAVIWFAGRKRPRNWRERTVSSVPPIPLSVHRFISSTNKPSRYLMPGHCQNSSHKHFFQHARNSDRTVQRSTYAHKVKSNQNYEREQKTSLQKTARRKKLLEIRSRVCQQGLMQTNKILFRRKRNSNHQNGNNTNSPLWKITKDQSELLQRMKEEQETQTENFTLIYGWTTHSVTNASLRATAQRSKTASVGKVSIMVLLTFPTGMLMGYIIIAMAFCLLHRRWLCCTEKCEELMSRKIYDPEGPGLARRRRLPRLSTVQVSARHEYVPKVNPVRQPMQKLLEEQFQEDRRVFLSTGKDPGINVDVNIFKPFKDSPNLTRKEWLTKRLQWWLARDRYRCMTGTFSDPNAPPDENPALVSGIEWFQDKKKGSHGSSDFTSVSQPPRRLGSSVSAQMEPANVREKLHKMFHPREKSQDEISQISSLESGTSSETGATSTYLSDELKEEEPDYME